MPTYAGHALTAAARMRLTGVVEFLQARKDTVPIPDITMAERHSSDEASSGEGRCQLLIGKTRTVKQRSPALWTRPMA